MPESFTGTSAGVPDYVKLCQEFLYAVRTDKSVEAYLVALKQADEAVIVKQLPEDKYSLAFWINLYNAFVQYYLRKNQNLYKSRNKFYAAKTIEFAGHSISLDTIEHGILRRSTLQWSLGYIRNPFPSAFEKRYRLNKLDYRIHFALNCGAASCPPIAFYKPEYIQEQLDLAAAAYLSGECEYDRQKNIITVPQILLWFRGDFGGKRGVVQLLQTYDIIPPQVKPSIRYKSYNWALQLDKYS